MEPTEYVTRHYAQARRLNLWRSRKLFEKTPRATALALTPGPAERHLGAKQLILFS
jgi:hypothetical protein